MQRLKMRIKLRYFAVISIFLMLVVLGWLSGYLKLFAPLPLQLVKIEISGYGLIKIPEGVSVVHRNWVHPENRIELTFNKEIDPKQETELLLFQNGMIGVVHPEHVPEERLLPIRKYDMWKVEGRKLTIQPVNPERGLHMFFVTLILPTELKAADGTTLVNDTFVWLSSMRSSPQSLVETGFKEGRPLSLPVYGKDDGRTLAYLLEDTPLFSNPDLQSSNLAKLVSGENVEVIKTEEGWSQVKVYYPKYNYSDPAMDNIPANFDVWNSDLVKTEIGYIPSLTFQVIPRPRNHASIVSVNYYMTGHDSERKVIGVGVNLFPAANAGGNLKPGVGLSSEQVDYLEAFGLWRFDYYTAGRSAFFGPQYAGNNTWFSLHSHDHPVYDMQVHLWPEDQYNRYLRIRQLYLNELDKYWQEFQVVPKYQKWKEGFYQAFNKTAKLEDIWINWSRVDRNLKIESLAQMVSEGLGSNPEEKAVIYQLISQEPKNLDKGVMAKFFNQYIHPKLIVQEGMTEGEKLFTEQY